MKCYLILTQSKDFFQISKFSMITINYKNLLQN